MEKRKLVCEEAGGSISKRKGFGQIWSQRELGPDPSSHVEGWRVPTAPPSTRLTAWVCLLQPWLSDACVHPCRRAHTHAQVCPGPAPLSMDQRGGMDSVSHPTLRASF